MMLPKLNKLKIAALICSLFIFISCENPFQFSLYDADTSDSNVNEKNLARIISSKDDNDTLTIAVFADSHNYYHELRKTVRCINSVKNVDFVIVGGDVTETGLLNQYETYLNEISKLKTPYITVIGNHDFLSNGSKIYQKLFGPVNFYFDYYGYRFVCFNDNVWENGNKAPEFDWLDEVLHEGKCKSVVVAHIQPWTDAQLGEKYSTIYENVIESNEVILSVGGHSHGFAHTVKKDIHYLISGSVTTGGVSIIKIFNKGEVKIERIHF